MENLPLQVTFIYHISIDNAQRADPCCRQVIGSRRAKPARANQQYLRIEQFELALLAHFGYQQMATVAFVLRLAEGAWLHKWQPTALPLTKTTRHGDYVRVAHLLKGVA